VVRIKGGWVCGGFVVGARFAPGAVKPAKAHSDTR
jgi:hypothetical protein